MMKGFSMYLFIALSVTLVNCNNNTKDVAESGHTVTKIEDPQAEELVAKMEVAMGGMDAWQQVKYVSWTFFGVRRLLWDKVNERVRIENPQDTSVTVVNINTGGGKYWKNGKLVSDTAKINMALKRGKSIWINDSYWLAMPFKLRDEGVTVRYVRKDTLSEGINADVLQLTFTGVGETPQNKYEIYIDRRDQMIKQWSYYKDANDSVPAKTWPWDNYKDYNGLKISTDRSDKSGPSNVTIYEDINDDYFTKVDKTISQLNK